MFPYKTIIEIEKNSDMPVYIQIANSFAREIRNGLLKPGTKLPGARSMADLLNVNRNTIAAVYEELNLQGYVQLLPKKGAFISERIPEIKAKPILEETRRTPYAEKSGYRVNRLDLPEYTGMKKGVLEFNDGLPDERLAPLEELTRAYRSVYRRSSRVQFSYTDVEGNPNLRQAISDHLNELRGYQTTADNIFITRGSQMGIYLVSQLLLNEGDVVITGETNYPAADLAFRHAGATIIRAKIDHLGIDTDVIRTICMKRKVRAVYVTPHHHFPTTVTLSACRRMNLLALAEKFGFAILEDDYDFDFHYASSPILPLASADNKGMVISIGSMSKNFSPALRVAYLVAPVNVIRELSKLRMIIDRQGDYILEQAVSELYKEGVINRHLRKVLRIYQERRDFLAELLKTHLDDRVNFTTPAGGLAIWTEFNKKLPLPKIAEAAFKKGLIINDGLMYNPENKNLNATRLGFASMDYGELEKSVKILAQCVKSLG
jgi:GntR family transcriptional regulator / MocR family aminotransferase